MIIFDLSCNDDHRFEGWFRSSEDFSAQQGKGLVSCPHCGSAEIRRIPSALHVASSKAMATQRVSEPEKPTKPVPVTPHPMTSLKAAVERLVSNSEDVGNAFAEEARKIHYHETPARLIHGQASEDDCSALKEEGIDVIRLPSIKPEDMN